MAESNHTEQVKNRDPLEIDIAERLARDMRPLRIRDAYTPSPWSAPSRLECPAAHARRTQRQAELEKVEHRSDSDTSMRDDDSLLEIEKDGEHDAKSLSLC